MMGFDVLRAETATLFHALLHPLFEGAGATEVFYDGRPKPRGDEQRYQPCSRGLCAA
jgi:hypothetical protein